MDDKKKIQQVKDQRVYTNEKAQQDKLGTTKQTDRYYSITTGERLIFWKTVFANTKYPKLGDPTNERFVL